MNLCEEVLQTKLQVRLRDEVNGVYDQSGDEAVCAEHPNSGLKEYEANSAGEVGEEFGVEDVVGAAGAAGAEEFGAEGIADDADAVNSVDVPSDPDEAAEVDVPSGPSALADPFHPSGPYPSANRDEDKTAQVHVHKVPEAYTTPELDLDLAAYTEGSTHKEPTSLVGVVGDEFPVDHREHLAEATWELGCLRGRDLLDQEVHR